MCHPSVKAGFNTPAGVRLLVQIGDATQAARHPSPDPESAGSILERLQAIEPDPRRLHGDAFRAAARLVARQVTIDEPTPLDEESLRFPI